MMSKNEQQVRRRSSKACDQCRKSKCKCERSSPQDPCRNCVMLGTGESFRICPLHVRAYTYLCHFGGALSFTRIHCPYDADNAP